MTLGLADMATGSLDESWEHLYGADGVLSMWDGVWNAGPGLHVSSSSVWKNLVPGGPDLSVETAARFGANCLERVAESTVPAAGFAGNPECLSIEAVCDAWSPVFNYTFMSAGAVANVRYATVVDSVIRCGKTGGQHKYVDMGAGFTHRPLCLVINYAAADSYDPVSVFVDGVQRQVLSQSSGAGENGAGQFYLMGRRNNAYSYPSGQRIYRFCLRSRAVSAAEAAANYAVDRVRFGLP